MITSLRTLLRCCFLFTTVWLGGCSPLSQSWDSAHSSFSHLFDSTIWSAIRTDYQFDDDGMDHKAVQDQVDWYERHAGALSSRLAESQYNIQWVYRAVEQRHLPSELVIIPYVESCYDPFAHSHVGAAGLWQLMPGTASGLGLDIDWWFDARRDLNLSTENALDHLEYLYEQFDHDWLLAIAAYDSGEGTIQRAIARNKKLGKPTDFWSLKLPSETRQYIPRLLAIRAILDNPEKYGVTLPEFARDNVPKTVPIDKQINIADLTKWAGMTEVEFRRLNAGFRRFATPPRQVVTLYVPPQNYQTMLAQLHVHGDDDLSGHWQTVIVESGDTLSEIAERHDSSTQAIKIANHLKSDMIRVGQRLVIPGSIADAEGVKDSHLAKQISGDHLPGPKQVIYHVKSGDTLQRVAKRYHTSSRAIAYWNHLSPKASLKIGQKLVIWQPKAVAHSRTIKVKAGDCLSILAHRYHVTVQAIRRANHMNNDNLRIGQKLVIPPSSN